MSWASDLSKITEKGSKNLGVLARAIKIELFSGIVSDTRVDTGRLRGNWQITELSPASGELERLDKSGSTVNSEIESKSTETGNTFFVNNLPYAKVYEQEDAMIARNIARVKNNISKMARDIKG